MLLRPNKSADLKQLDNKDFLSNISYQPANMTHALCLTVFLTKASFSTIIYDRGSRTILTNDLKIEVFFNGQFIDSRIINHNQFSCSGTRGMKARIVRFTGQKISRMIEKPWVFVSPDHRGNTTQDSFSQHDRTEDEDVSLRWTAVSDRLLAEADEIGRDVQGDRPIIGDYLQGLALLPLPSEIKNLRTRGAGFGVIDVVVIWGIGQKDGPESTYLTKPTRMRAKQHPTKRNVAGEGHDSQTPRENSISSEAKHTKFVVSTPAFRPCDTSSITFAPGAKAASAIAPQTPSGPLRTVSTLDRSGDQTPKPSNRLIHELFPPDRSSSNAPPKRSRAPSTTATPNTTTSQPSDPSKRRRKAMPYHHVLTTKQTLAEELQSIAEQAADDVHSRRTRAKLVNATQAQQVVDSSPLSTAPPSSAEEVSLVETPKQSKVVTLKISPEKLANSPAGQGSPSSDYNSTPRQHRPMMFATPRHENTRTASTPTSQVLVSSQHDHTSPSSGADSTRAATAPAETLQSQSRRRPRTSTQLTSTTEVFDADFQIPELSMNSCITYAEPGVVRNVGAVRGGWFEEKGVVMGTRFIIG